jgi:hypothetical protein
LLVSLLLASLLLASLLLASLLLASPLVAPDDPTVAQAMPDPAAALDPPALFPFAPPPIDASASLVLAAPAAAVRPERPFDVASTRPAQPPRAIDRLMTRAARGHPVEVPLTRFKMGLPLDGRTPASPARAARTTRSVRIRHP